jgi:iron complex transport system substrate-binding protein
VKSAPLVTGLFCAASLLACGPADRPPDPDAAPPARAEAVPGSATTPGRVISLIPATTEMIFAMGAGSRLVGVGTYDRFPPEVEGLRRVGGLVDPDTEGIITLRPDLVVVYDTQVELMARLDRAGIPYFPYEHRELVDIMGTVRALGGRLGLPDAAEAVAAGMETALDRVQASVEGLPRPRTLLVFGREPQALRNIYASGGYGFLADLLDVAGGDNVFGDIERQSLQASTEMILARQPEAIVELRYGRAAGQEASAAAADWAVLASVPAVRARRIHVLTGDEFVVPGPRVTLAAKRLAAAIHGIAP